MSMRGTGRFLSLSVVLGVLTAGTPAFALSGEQVYVREGCQVCHGGLGEGGVGVRFVGDPFLAFQDYIVGRVLLGGGEMPPFAGKIPDEDIAAVVSYIRGSWGNHLAEVSAQQAAAVRERLQSEAVASGSSAASQSPRPVSPAAGK